MLLWPFCFWLIMKNNAIKKILFLAIFRKAIKKNTVWCSRIISLLSKQNLIKILWIKLIKRLDKFFYIKFHSILANTSNFLNMYAKYTAQNVVLTLRYPKNLFKGIFLEAIFKWFLIKRIMFINFINNFIIL